MTTAAKLGDKWRLYTGNPAALLPQVVDYARSQGVQIISLNTLSPSLEDVFLAITGQGIGAVRHNPPEQAPRRRKGGQS